MGQAYAKIREQILSGAYATGQRLVEDELAALTGVSRTPVREALNLLRAEGLVDGEARRGVRVAAWSDDELDEIYGLRAILEGYGARLAATKVTDEDLARLDRLCAAMESLFAEFGAAAVDPIAELNNELHATIFRATANRRLIASLSSIVELPSIHRAMARYGTTRLVRSLSDHREIVAALRRRDGELAGSLMQAHIHSARAELAAAAKR